MLNSCESTAPTVGSQVSIKHGDMRIGRKEATAILADCPFAGQRTIYVHQTRLLSSMMQRGEWYAGDQLTFCSLPNGQVILVNGYHRMTAIIDSNSSQVFNVRIIPAKDMEDVRRAYASFDTATRKRTDGEVLQAMGVVESFGLHKQMATAVFRSAPLIANRFGTQNYQTQPEVFRDMTSRILAAGGFWAHGVTYQELIKPASQKLKTKLLMAPVTAVAIVTIQNKPLLARAFWSGLASGTGLGKGDPRLALAKALVDRKYVAILRNGEIPASAQDVAVAWNAFYSHRSINTIRTAAFRIAGTRW